MSGEHGLDTGCQCTGCIAERALHQRLSNRVEQDLRALKRYAWMPSGVVPSTFGLYVKVEDVHQLLLNQRFRDHH